MNHRVLEIVNETDRALDPSLGIAGQRPVARDAQGPAQPGQPGIESHQKVVGDVAEHRYPAVMARHLIELVAMEHQVAPSVGGGMDEFADHLDVAERGVDIFAQSLVMVARNQHHLIAVTRPAQHLLHQGVLQRRPVDGPVHRPEIDDVADQKQLLRLVLAQEVQQSFRLTAARAEVDVGEKNGAVFRHGSRERSLRSS